ncbi:MAG: bifunctional riboflavin kinase/FAD synthetase [Burkholderiales bacterium]
MEIITLEQARRIKFCGLSIALGTFDGLHIGHMALINALLGFGGKSAVFTFDSLPSDLFLAEHKPSHLFTLEEKAAAFCNAGIDYLCIARFDRKFAGINKTEFASTIINTFSPVNIVAGYNYTYGRHAQGNADTLKSFAEKHGCNVVIIPPVIFDGEPVSSTRIRECIAAGGIERANALLGYRYSVSGTVEKGTGLGNKLGFPTANITADREKILPLRGVYSVSVAVGGSEYKGVCNIGVKPTVSNGVKETIEVHIIGLSADLYGQNVTIYFNKRIRDEKKFASKEELAAQIKRDIASI